MKRARPIGDLLGATLGPALAAQGFSGADIVASWPEIVGERLAARSRPLKVEWPRRRPGPDTGGRPEPATLVIRVESAFALEFQHLAPLLLERINAVYGWRCVGRIVLKQGPVAPRTQAALPARTMTAADRQRIAAAIDPIDDEGLRSALGRLGSAMASSPPAPVATPEASGPEPAGGERVALSPPSSPLS